ncbi:MAG: CdvA-like protein [Candidatus Bathyarchaeia archaeon]
MSQPSNLFLSIGKPVKDEYGRTIGKIASFALTPSGQFEAAFIEFSDGKFSKQPITHLKFDGGEITFISTIKSRANILCDQIPLLWRKDQALKDLAEKKKITPELYQELHSSFESMLNQLKKDAQLLIDEATDKIEQCEEELRTMSYAVVNLEIEHEIGKVDDATYKSAFAQLQETLKRITAQKTDIEQTKTKVSNMLLGDTQDLEQKIKTKISAESKLPVDTTAEALELPEPPVVVYVKEVGKAGI